MKDFIYDGDVYLMSILLILGSIMLIPGLVFIFRRITKVKKSILDRKLLFSIITVGSFTFLVGLFFQVWGLYDAFQAIKMASEISPPILMHGVFLSFYTSIMGLGVFAISFVIWSTLKVVYGFKELKPLHC